MNPSSSIHPDADIRGTACSRYQQRTRYSPYRTPLPCIQPCRRQLKRSCDQAQHTQDPTERSLTSIFEPYLDTVPLDSSTQSSQPLRTPLDRLLKRILLRAPRCSPVERHREVEQKSVNQASVPTRLVTFGASLVFAFLLSASRTHFLVTILVRRIGYHDLGISVGERRSGRRVNVKSACWPCARGWEGDLYSFVTVARQLLLCSLE